MDTNKSRVKRKRQQAKNRTAFNEVIGNPFLGIDGVYITLKSRSAVGCIEGKYGEAVENVDAAKPSISDFICDVQKVLLDGLDFEWYTRFTHVYLYGETDGEHSIPKAVRNTIEQKIGQLLRNRGIYPVKRYFTVTKK